MVSISFCNCYSRFFRLFYRNKKINLLNNIISVIKTSVNDKLAKKGAFKF